MLSVKALVVLLCLVFLAVSVFGDDSGSIDGGYNYDYGKHRPVAEREPARKYPSFVKYYRRKFKPRKPTMVDGLPLYRD